jgi:hypothetical protein
MTRRKWGWVWKSCGLLGAWQRRFMVVSGNGSCYFFYKEIHEMEAARIAHLRQPLHLEGAKQHTLAGATIVRQRSHPAVATIPNSQQLHPFTLNLATSGYLKRKVLQLAASSSQESFGWALAIGQCTNSRPVLPLHNCVVLHNSHRKQQRLQLRSLFSQHGETPEKECAMGTKKHECAICFDPLHTEATGVLRKNGARVCRHIYHIGCLSKLQDKRCPICRAECGHFLTIPSISEDPSKWFQVADSKGDGRLSMQEIAEVLSAQFPINKCDLDEQLPALFKHWDLDGSGYIYYDEMMHPTEGLFKFVCECREFVDGKRKVQRRCQTHRGLQKPGSVDKRPERQPRNRTSRTVERRRRSSLRLQQQFSTHTQRPL